MNRATKGVIYTVSATLLALAALAATLPLTSLTTFTDQVYVPLACALVVGLLLTVRQAPGHPGAALILLPVVVADARLGLAALPALLVAALLANMARGLRGSS